MRNRCHIESCNSRSQIRPGNEQHVTHKADVARIARAMSTALRNQVVGYKTNCKFAQRYPHDESKHLLGITIIFFQRRVCEVLRFDVELYIFLPWHVDGDLLARRPIGHVLIPSNRSERIVTFYISLVDLQLSHHFMFSNKGLHPSRSDTRFPPWFQRCRWCR